jgi:hypothetical protein
MSLASGSSGTLGELNVCPGRILNSVRHLNLADAGWIAARASERKVRSPQGNVPANGREGSLKGIFTESTTENLPPGFFGSQVRVKRCGKSAPRTEQSVRQGKPHAEQDQIGEEERPAPLYFRVGRYSLARKRRARSHVVMRGLDEWLSPARVQKPAYSPASANYKVMPIFALLISHRALGRAEHFAMLILIVTLVVFLVSRRGQ